MKVQERLSTLDANEDYIMTVTSIQGSKKVRLRKIKSFVYYWRLYHDFTRRQDFMSNKVYFNGTIRQN